MLAQSISAPGLVDRIASIMRANLPPTIPPTYFDGFYRRHRDRMVEVVATQLRAKGRLLDPAQDTWISDLPPDLWTISQRTDANLRAMSLLAQKSPDALTDADRRVIVQYSGWGGLSIEKVKDRFPVGFPIPEQHSLIHEYYTPTRIANEVVRVIAPYLEKLKSADGIIKALEPSAGIGRFLRPFADLRRGPQRAPDLDWTLVELSPVSARLLSALFPAAAVFNMPFEQWIRDHSEQHQHTYKLLLANPPYGPRGALLTQDGDRAFRVKQAYLYFLFRCLDLLAPGALAVFLIPAGFMTSLRLADARARVLKRLHLLGAFRLPSQSRTTRDPIFPGANLVTDLIFFQARDGELADTLPDDQYILEGRYFKAHPDRIIGEEYDGDLSDDHTAKPRRRYAVLGEFESLPPLDPRSMQTGVYVTATRSTQRRGGVTREFQAPPTLPDDLLTAVALGMRVDRYLSAISRGDSELAIQAWSELNGDLMTWLQLHGNPHKKAALLELSRQSNAGAQRFLTAFTREGNLVEALARPPVHEPVYRGDPTLLGQCDWTFRQRGRLTVQDAATLAGARRAVPLQGTSGDSEDPGTLVSHLTRAGWCLDGPDLELLVPESHYYSGDLWPKVDVCAAHAHKNQVAAQQLARLMERIRPAVLEDLLDGLTPREPWLPVEVVQAWVQAALVGERDGSGIELERAGGTLQPKGVRYDDFVRQTDQYQALGYTDPAIWFLGWANHHLALFRPPQPKEIIDGVPQRVPLDEVRLEVSSGWCDSFVQWLRAHPDAHARVEHAYNRSLRGYIAPAYSGEPLAIARWGAAVEANNHSPLLFDYQWQAARRIVANRCGLLAFDVGLGKTYTGLAILARARQEGWARRPVVVVPNSIVWKWYRDISRCLPDYRVLVIGSTRKVMASGPRKGRMAAETDSPADRADKWTRFQSGQADVVLLTYSALGRTRVDPDVLERFVGSVSAIQRQISIGRAKARTGKEKRLSERQQATLEVTVEGWIAERLEANSNWEYDPGIEWHSLGIDLLMIDESQNFKNLFGPEEREGGIPDAMGGSAESKRAWQLDFRCASVREHSGGAGVILLSATPAKNGPVEFYNAIHLIQPTAWEQVGITDPEAFIDRYCAFEARTAMTPDGRLTVRQACTAFKNLHELRDVIFRYADFKTAEDVGLKIPDAENFEHRVDLNPAQVSAIQVAWSEIRDLREEMKQLHGEAAARVREALRLKILGVAMRVDLIAIHEALPSVSKLSRAEIAAIHPHSGKIDAVISEIMATSESVCSKEDPGWCLSCGHIVFVENVAVHQWLKAALMKSGLPAHRIAILNADVAADPETRQQLAERFNGVGRPGDEDYEPPAFDVVIANSVAYEGVDLQRRTCAIHHMDLPWDPATLQQRNGRGVRQGNKFERVKIHYYLGRPSGDGRRLTLIAKKRSWMASLVKSQDRVTNNPGATVNVSIEDIFLDIVPPAERDRVLKEREEEARAILEQQKRRTRIAANKMLSQANARFRRAEQSGDPAESGRLRKEAEALLSDLGKIDADAWPWFSLAQRVRTQAAWIPEQGPPLFPDQHVHVQGRPVWLGVSGTDGDGSPVLGVVPHGSITWRTQTAAEVGQWAGGLEPQDFTHPVPDPLDPTQLQGVIDRELRYRTFFDLNWHLASQGWLEHWWPRLSDSLVRQILQTAHRGFALPFHHRGALQLKAQAANALPSGSYEVLPPSDAGWRSFLELARSSSHRFSELDEAARAWWRRRLPRDLLSSQRSAQSTEVDAAVQRQAALKRAPSTQSAVRRDAQSPPLSPQSPIRRSQIESRRRADISTSRTTTHTHKKWW